MRNVIQATGSADECLIVVAPLDLSINNKMHIDCRQVFYCGRMACGSDGVDRRGPARSIQWLRMRALNAPGPIATPWRAMGLAGAVPNAV